MDALVLDGFASETHGPRGSRLLVSRQPFRTSSDFVATSSDEIVATSSTSSRPYRGDEDEDEVEAEVTSSDEDELERLLTKHADLAGGAA
jgi:hypothetical protein